MKLCFLITMYFRDFIFEIISGSTEKLSRRKKYSPCAPSPFTYTLPSLLAHSVKLLKRFWHTVMGPQFMWGSLLWPSVENKLKGSLPTRALCRAAQNYHYTCEAGFVLYKTANPCLKSAPCSIFFLSLLPFSPRQPPISALHFLQRHICGHTVFSLFGLAHYRSWHPCWFLLWPLTDAQFIHVCSVSNELNSYPYCFLSAPVYPFVHWTATWLVIGKSENCQWSCCAHQHIISTGLPQFYSGWHLD